MRLGQQVAWPAAVSPASVRAVVQHPPAAYPPALRRRRGGITSGRRLVQRVRRARWHRRRTARAAPAGGITSGRLASAPALAGHLGLHLRWQLARDAPDEVRLLVRVGVRIRVRARVRVRVRARGRATARGMGLGSRWAGREGEGYGARVTLGRKRGCSNISTN